MKQSKVTNEGGIEIIFGKLICGINQKMNTNYKKLFRRELVNLLVIVKNHDYLKKM